MLTVNANTVNSTAAGWSGDKWVKCGLAETVYSFRVNDEHHWMLTDLTLCQQIY